MAKKYFKFSSIKNKKFTVDTTSETIKKQSYGNLYWH